QQIDRLWPGAPSLAPAAQVNVDASVLVLGRQLLVKLDAAGDFAVEFDDQHYRVVLAAQVGLDLSGRVWLAPPVVHRLFGADRARWGSLRRAAWADREVWPAQRRAS